MGADVAYPQSKNLFAVRKYDLPSHYTLSILRHCVYEASRLAVGGRVEFRMSRIRIPLSIAFPSARPRYVVRPSLEDKSRARKRYEYGRVHTSQGDQQGVFLRNTQRQGCGTETRAPWLCAEKESNREGAADGLVFLGKMKFGFPRLAAELWRRRLLLQEKAAEGSRRKEAQEPQARYVTFRGRR